MKRIYQLSSLYSEGHRDILVTFKERGDGPAAPTTGDGQQVSLPGEDVEHATHGDAGQRAIVAT